MKTKMIKVLVCAMVVAMLAGCQSKEAEVKTSTYTGTGKGYDGDVVVTITVNDETKEITDVETTGTDETVSAGGETVEKLDANFLAAQLSLIHISLPILWMYWKTM